MLLSLFCTAALLASGVARAEEEQVPEPVSAERSSYTFGGYAEALYHYNVNRPQNGITNYRGFDNRHNSFTLANVVLSFAWDVRNVFGLVAAQVGHTPSTYYLSEPDLRGTNAANASNAALWKYLQQAYIGYQFEHELSVAAGLFFSPIGPESMRIYENWNWSRSNLFFGLPFYHTGVRGIWQLSHWQLSLAAYNGWNSVVDNNQRKSLAAQARYERGVYAWTLTYFGGAERPLGAPEGQAFRQQLDTHFLWQAHAALSLLLHANAGLEPNHMGLSHWQAGAAYVRAKILPFAYLSARGDLFREHRAEKNGVRAAPIFWPAEWVASGTLTLDVRPRDAIAVMLEFRSDHAASDMFFKGQVRSDAEGLMLVNARRQNTLTLGATAWF